MKSNKHAGNRMGSRPARLGLLLLIAGFAAVQCRPRTTPHRPAPRDRTSSDPFDAAGALQMNPSDLKFAFKSGPKPPKRVGERLTIAFPPPQKPGVGPGAVKSLPLQVIRVQPKGDAQLQNAVTVSFNQPMVPLASLADLRKLPVPLRVTPAIDGRARWLGTRTLSWESKKRIPYSTRFEAVIPAGTKSQAGRSLDQEYRWSFETPRLAIKQILPHRSNYHALPNTPIAILFNQKVDPEKIAAAIQLQSSHKVGLDLVPRAEWKKLKPYGVIASKWEKDRTVVLRPRKVLRKNTWYHLSIPVGTVAGEGPLPTKNLVASGFRTYGPLQLIEVRCGWTRNPCRPRTSKYLHFTNQLKSEELAQVIRLNPPVADLRLQKSHSNVFLHGSFQARTRYTVTVLGSIEDVYDQRMGKAAQKSFFVGDFQPELSMPVSGMRAVTEGQGAKELRLKGVNVPSGRVRIKNIPPEKIGQALQKMQLYYHWQYRKKWMAGEMPGRETAFNARFTRQRNKRQEVVISLRRALAGKPSGFLFVEVYAPALQINRWSNPYRRLLVQVTDVGVTTRYSADRVVALVTGLGSGKPAAGVEMAMYDYQGKAVHRGQTDARGVFDGPGARKLGQRGPFVLVAKRGDDLAFVPLTGSGMGWALGYNRYSGLPAKQMLRLVVFNERSPYRPGETAHITGMVRLEGTEVGGGTEPLPKGFELRYWLRDGRSQLKQKDQKIQVGADGMFSFSYKIPADAALGHWRLRLLSPALGMAPVGNHYHTFRVLEYRTPEYKVGVKVRGEPYFFGDRIRAAVTGRYYHGTAMAGAPVTWTLRRSVGAFRPPNHASFRFGELRDWSWRWRYNRGFRGGRYGTYFTTRGADGAIIAQGEGKLTPDGRLEVASKLDFWKKGHGPGTVGAFTLEAQVFDKNRQAIAGRKQVTVHPASVYVGLRMKKPLVRAKEDSEVQAVVTDLAGKRVAGKALRLVATEQIYQRKPIREDGYWRFQYKLVEKPVGGCSLTTSTDVGSCKLRLPRAGYFRIRAVTTDAKGRKTRTVIGVYAVGKRFVPWKQNNADRLELIVGKKEYRPGEKAEVLIKSPFRAAEGLLTVERKGIREYRRLSLRSSVHVERVDLGDKDIPNVTVSVVLVRGRIVVPGVGKAGADLGRPKYAFGQKVIRISRKKKQLQVAVKADPGTLRPGGTARVQVVVTDAAGKPVPGARLAVMVVDEGVLSLLGFRVPDPVEIFHNIKAAGTAGVELRQDLIKQKKPYKVRTRTTTRYPRRFLSRNRSVRLDGFAGPKSKRGHAGGGGVALGGTVLQPAAPPAGRASAASESAPRDEAKAEDKRGALREGDTGGAPPLVFKTHKNFATTAFFDASARTDGAGRAELLVKLPENLTTFRINAVAMDTAVADRFGRGEGRVNVRRPLMLQPSLPRFANFGDRFEAAVKVTNETGKTGVVHVKIEGANAAVIGPRSKTVKVGASRTEEVRFHVAVGRPGRARFRFHAYLGRETDSVELGIPVNLPATSEAFATYGVTTDSVAQTIQPPKDALSGFGGLDLAFSSTALTGMEDAVRYLVDYRYECSEQTASRVIPIFALRKILPAFRLLGKKTEDGDSYAVKIPAAFLKKHKGVKARAELERRYMEYLARTGIAKLVAYQRYDGGYGYWSGGARTWPYPTAWSTFALLRAKEAGYAVPTTTLTRSANWLSNFLNYRWRNKRYYLVSLTMRAMAAWILSEMKDAPYLSKWQKRQLKLTQHLTDIYRARKLLPLFGKAFLMVAMHRVGGMRSQVANLLAEIDNAAIQTTPYKVHFAEQKTESLRVLMHSESRTDAIVLAALMELKPDHPLVAKVVRGLIEARVRGRWETTQSNAYALLALSRYYKHYEKVVPDFQLGVWLGEGFVGGTGFKGRTMRVVEQRIPMAFVQKQGPKKLILSKRGKGKLYYRLGLRYAPTSLKLAPEEQGFTVTRRYEAIEPGTVTQVKYGHWRIKAGKYVRVRLTIVVPDRRYFVAVDDPLPAGLEAVDLSLKTSASSTLGNQAKNKIYDFFSWYSFFAFSHQEKRDDRVVLFSNRLPSGVYEYTYLARATTLGRFVVPPLKAHEMYHPEVFGRNGTNVVEVVE